MTRRKTKTTGSGKRSGAKSAALAARKVHASHSKALPAETRFKVSLVILIALLSASAYFFVFALIGSSSVGKAAPVVNRSLNLANVVPAKPSVLNDSSLDFRLTMPAQLGNWIYKTGQVKSAVDDTISDQYVKIYVPQPGVKGAAANNFDLQYQDILTVVKMTQDEWKKLDKACQKGAQDKCGAEGTKISENKDSVYTYTKGTDCPKEILAKCALVGKITDSFQLK